jgi:NADP-dependent 3-hydroxy acid dehydrogenase YdfG
MTQKPFLSQVAIVTGASRGIGRATALDLARLGARVALASRREGLLVELAGEIGNLGGEDLAIPTDVTDQKQVEAMVQKTLERWGQVDILVSNAGEYVRASLSDITVETIEHSLAVNYYGGVYAILTVLPHMKVQRRGHIVVVTSMDGKKGLPPDAPYASAKFALTGFAEVLRQQLHGSGVHVSNVLPGRVDTEMINYLTVPRISAKIPPEAVAQAIVRAILQRKPEVIVPFHAGFLHYANVFSPRLGDWLVRRLRLDGWDDE